MRASTWRKRNGQGALLAAPTRGNKDQPTWGGGHRRRTALCTVSMVTRERVGAQDLVPAREVNSSLGR
jgi:hypothetical protein